MITFPCYKCNGTGMTSFRHIENGVCFACGGSGQLSYRKREKAFVDPHPELVVDEAIRSTMKQWDYLDKLTGESDDKACRFLREAGAPFATRRYVSKVVMSRAIELARGARR